MLKKILYLVVLVFSSLPIFVSCSDTFNTFDIKDNKNSLSLKKFSKDCEKSEEKLLLNIISVDSFSTEMIRLNYHYLGYNYNPKKVNTKRLLYAISPSDISDGENTIDMTDFDESQDRKVRILSEAEEFLQTLSNHASSTYYILNECAIYTQNIPWTNEEIESDKVMTEHEKYSLINYKAELIQMKKETLLKSDFFNIEENNYNQVNDSNRFVFTKEIRRIGWKRPLTSDEKKKAQLCMEVFNTTVNTCEINTSLQLAKNWWTALKKEQ